MYKPFKELVVGDFEGLTADGIAHILEQVEQEQGPWRSPHEDFLRAQEAANEIFNFNR